MSLRPPGRFASITSSAPPIPETTRCGEPKLDGRSSKPGSRHNHKASSAGRGSKAARASPVEWAILRPVYLNRDLRQGVGEFAPATESAQWTQSRISTRFALSTSRGGRYAANDL